MNLADRRLLQREASRLVERLKVFQPPLRFESKRTLEDIPDMAGGWITLAKWTGFPELGITFDRCLGFENPKFWVGFYSPVKRKLRSFVETLPGELHFRLTLTDESFKRQGTNWFLKKRPSNQALRYPVFETYSNGLGSYFGIYDVCEGRSPHKLDVERAARLVRQTIEANYFYSAAEIDENAQKMEGSSVRKYVNHRRREVKLRLAKIRQVLRRNGGRLTCEVPNCNFDFRKRYGDLGAGYAHVHHKEQLSNAPKTGTLTSLNDLVIVCANCHAMIHKGGQCRPLEGLIPITAVSS
jgi:hypothetical protein